MILDASVLIALLDDQDAHHDAAVAVLDPVLDHDEPLRMHAVNLAEVLVGPAKAGRLDDAVRLLAPLGIEEVNGPASELARVRAESSLRMPDCCVLLAAQVAADDTIATFDARLAAVAVQRGLHVRP